MGPSYQPFIVYLRIKKHYSMTYSYKLCFQSNSLLTVISLRQITLFKSSLRKKYKLMKFKNNQFTHPHFEENHDSPSSTLPEQRSTVLNDSNSSLRSFIQNLRNIVGGEEQQQSEGLIVLFGIDEQTGNLSLGIAKHQVKKIESNLEKYKDRIIEAASLYEHDQTAILQKYSKSLEEITKRKIIYSNWKQKCKQNLILNFINEGFQSLVDYPRMNKQRSASNDTAQTLQVENNYLQVDDEEWINPLDELDQSLMQVE